MSNRTRKNSLILDGVPQRWGISKEGKKILVPKHAWWTLSVPDVGEVEMFRIYRHGNINDIFQVCWMTTDPTIQEAGPYDFDLRELFPIVGSHPNEHDFSVERFILNSIEGTLERLIFNALEGKCDDCSLNNLAAIANSIKDAIRDGLITVPPQQPGAKQLGGKP